MNDPRRITMLYDGRCPLCCREVRLLRRHRRGDRLAFEDITVEGFEASRYGVTERDAHARMHAVLPDGRVVVGMDAFRHVYRAIGLGWVVAPTGWPLLRPIFDMLYSGFARVRPRLQRGRCDDGACAN